MAILGAPSGGKFSTFTQIFGQNFHQKNGVLNYVKYFRMKILRRKKVSMIEKRSVDRLEWARQIDANARLTIHPQRVSTLHDNKNIIP